MPDPATNSIADMTLTSDLVELPQSIAALALPKISNTPFGEPCSLTRTISPSSPYLSIIGDN